MKTRSSPIVLFLGVPFVALLALSGILPGIIQTWNYWEIYRDRDGFVEGNIEFLHGKLSSTREQQKDNHKAKISYKLLMDDGHWAVVRITREVLDPTAFGNGTIRLFYHKNVPLEAQVIYDPWSLQLIYLLKMNRVSLGCVFLLAILFFAVRKEWRTRRNEANIKQTVARKDIRW